MKKQEKSRERLSHSFCVMDDSYSVSLLCSAELLIIEVWSTNVLECFNHQYALLGGLSRVQVQDDLSNRNTEMIIDISFFIIHAPL